MDALITRNNDSSDVQALIEPFDSLDLFADDVIERSSNASTKLPQILLWCPKFKSLEIKCNPIPDNLLNDMQRIRKSISVVPSAAFQKMEKRVVEQFESELLVLKNSSPSDDIPAVQEQEELILRYERRLEDLRLLLEMADAEVVLPSSQSSLCMSNVSLTSDAPITIGESAAIVGFSNLEILLGDLRAQVEQRESLINKMNLEKEEELESAKRALVVRLGDQFQQQLNYLKKEYEEKVKQMSEEKLKTNKIISNQSNNFLDHQTKEYLGTSRSSGKASTLVEFNNNSNTSKTNRYSANLATNPPVALTSLHPPSSSSQNLRNSYNQTIKSNQAEFLTATPGEVILTQKISVIDREFKSLQITLLSQSHKISNDETFENHKGEKAVELYSAVLSRQAENLIWGVSMKKRPLSIHALSMDSSQHEQSCTHAHVHGQPFSLSPPSTTPSSVESNNNVPQLLAILPPPPYFHSSAAASRISLPLPAYLTEQVDANTSTALAAHLPILQEIEALQKSVSEVRSLVMNPPKPQGYDEATLLIQMEQTLSNVIDERLYSVQRLVKTERESHSMSNLVASAPNSIPDLNASSRLEALETLVESLSIQLQQSRTMEERIISLLDSHASKNQSTLSSQQIPLVTKSSQSTIMPSKNEKLSLISPPLFSSSLLPLHANSRDAANSTLAVLATISSSNSPITEVSPCALISVQSGVVIPFVHQALLPYEQSLTAIEKAENYVDAPEIATRASVAAYWITSQPTIAEFVGLTAGGRDSFNNTISGLLVVDETEKQAWNSEKIELLDRLNHLASRVQEIEKIQMDLKHLDNKKISLQMAISRASISLTESDRESNITANYVLNNHLDEDHATQASNRFHIKSNDHQFISSNINRDDNLNLEAFTQSQNQEFKSILNQKLETEILPLQRQLNTQLVLEMNRLRNDVKFVLELKNENIEHESISVTQNAHSTHNQPAGITINNANDNIQVIRHSIESNSNLARSEQKLQTTENLMKEALPLEERLETVLLKQLATLTTSNVSGMEKRHLASSKTSGLLNSSNRSSSSQNGLIDGFLDNPLLIHLLMQQQLYDSDYDGDNLDATDFSSTSRESSTIMRYRDQNAFSIKTSSIHGEEPKILELSFSSISSHETVQRLQSPLIQGRNSAQQRVSVMLNESNAYSSLVKEHRMSNSSSSSAASKNILTNSDTLNSRKSSIMTTAAPLPAIPLFAIATSDQNANPTSVSSSTFHPSKILSASPLLSIPDAQITTYSSSTPSALLMSLDGAAQSLIPRTGLSLQCVERLEEIHQILADAICMRDAGSHKEEKGIANQESLNAYIRSLEVEFQQTLSKLEDDINRNTQQSESATDKPFLPRHSLGIRIEEVYSSSSSSQSNFKKSSSLLSSPSLNSKSNRISIIQTQLSRLLLNKEIHSRKTSLSGVNQSAGGVPQNRANNQEHKILTDPNVNNQVPVFVPRQSTSISHFSIKEVQQSITNSSIANTKILKDTVIQPNCVQPFNSPIEEVPFATDPNLLQTLGSQQTNYFKSSPLAETLPLGGLIANHLHHSPSTLNNSNNNIATTFASSNNVVQPSFQSNSRSSDNFFNFPQSSASNHSTSEFFVKEICIKPSTSFNSLTNIMKTPSNAMINVTPSVTVADATTSVSDKSNSRDTADKELKPLALPDIDVIDALTHHRLESIIERQKSSLLFSLALPSAAHAPPVFIPTSEYIEDESTSTAIVKVNLDSTALIKTLEIEEVESLQEDVATLRLSVFECAVNDTVDDEVKSHAALLKDLVNVLDEKMDKITNYLILNTTVKSSTQLPPRYSQGNSAPLSNHPSSDNSLQNLQQSATELRHLQQEVKRRFSAVDADNDSTKNITPDKKENQFALTFKTPVSSPQNGSEYRPVSSASTAIVVSQMPQNNSSSVSKTKPKEEDSSSIAMTEIESLKREILHLKQFIPSTVYTTQPHNYDKKRSVSHPNEERNVNTNLLSHLPEHAVPVTSPFDHLLSSARNSNNTFQVINRPNLLESEVNLNETTAFKHLADSTQALQIKTEIHGLDVPLGPGVNISQAEGYVKSLNEDTAMTGYMTEGSLSSSVSRPFGHALQRLGSSVSSSITKSSSSYDASTLLSSSTFRNSQVPNNRKSFHQDALTLKKEFTNNSHFGGFEEEESPFEIPSTMQGRKFESFGAHSLVAMSLESSSSGTVVKDKETSSEFSFSSSDEDDNVVVCEFEDSDIKITTTQTKHNAKSNRKKTKTTTHNNMRDKGNKDSNVSDGILSSSTESVHTSTSFEPSSKSPPQVKITVKQNLQSQNDHPSFPLQKDHHYHQTQQQPQSLYHFQQHNVPQSFLQQQHQQHPLYFHPSTSIAQVNRSAPEFGQISPLMVENLREKIVAMKQHNLEASEQQNEINKSLAKQRDQFENLENGLSSVQKRMQVLECDDKLLSSTRKELELFLEQYERNEQLEQTQMNNNKKGVVLDMTDFIKSSCANRIHSNKNKISEKLCAFNKCKDSLQSMEKAAFDFSIPDSSAIAFVLNFAKDLISGGSTSLAILKNDMAKTTERLSSWTISAHSRKSKAEEIIAQRLHQEVQEAKLQKSLAIKSLKSKTNDVLSPERCSQVRSRLIDSALKLRPNPACSPPRQKSLTSHGLKRVQKAEAMGTRLKKNNSNSLVSDDKRKTKHYPW